MKITLEEYLNSSRPVGEFYSLNHTDMIKDSGFFFIVKELEYDDQSSDRTKWAKEIIKKYSSLLVYDNYYIYSLLGGKTLAIVGHYNSPKLAFMEAILHNSDLVRRIVEGKVNTGYRMPSPQMAGTDSQKMAYALQAAENIIEKHKL